LCVENDDIKAFQTPSGEKEISLGVVNPKPSSRFKTLNVGEIFFFFFFFDFFPFLRKEKRGRAFIKRRRSKAVDGGGTGTPNILLAMNNNDNTMAHNRGVME